MKTNLKIIVFLGVIMLTAACQPALTPLPAQTTATAVRYSATLELVGDSTQTPEEDGQTEATLTPVPAPTATPQLHEVALDETMLSIAYAYGLSYDELQAANPEADPYSLIVGDTLIIPARTEEGEQSEAQSQSTVLRLSDVNCTPDSAGGLWCLFTVQAPADEDREVASAQIKLNGLGSNETLEVMATAPLNRLDAGQRMPLATYIDAETLRTAPFGAPYQAQVGFVQDLPFNSSDGRYLDLTLSAPEILISEDGRSAQVSTTLTMNAENLQPGSKVWLVAAAYTIDDECIGLRRWEAQTPLNAGESIAVSLTVFSVDGSAIDHIEVLTEARP